MGELQYVMLGCLGSGAEGAISGDRRIKVSLGIFYSRRLHE